MDDFLYVNKFKYGISNSSIIEKDKAGSGKVAPGPEVHAFHD